MLRPRLARPGRVLRLLDLAEMTAAPAEEVIQGSVTDLAAMTEACAGVSALIHLAGISGEAPWDQIAAAEHLRQLRGVRGRPPGRGRQGRLRLIEPRGRFYSPVRVPCRRLRVPGA